MGHLFHPTYTVLNKKTGERETRRSCKWYVEYVDGQGKRQRVPGYADKRATEHLLAQLEQEADMIRAGYLPSSASDVKRPLADHLASYLETLRAENAGEPHVKLVGQRCTILLEGCDFVRWCDLDADRVASFLAGLRAKPRRSKRCQRKKGISNRTSNHYLSQFRGFVRWLAKRFKQPDPLAELEPLNAEVDLRHVRRVLSPAHFAALVEAAAGSAVVILGQPGGDRAMLYVLAAYSGLRASELASLTPELVRVDGDPATVHVEAGYSKHRRADTVPIHADVARQLRTWLATKPSGALLWPGEWAADHHAAQMLRNDLDAAKLPYRDSRERVFDFHALRHQYITALAIAGVPIAHAQKLARHSSPVLTMKFYTHLETADLSEQAQKLPAPPATGDAQTARPAAEPPAA